MSVLVAPSILGDPLSALCIGMFFLENIFRLFVFFESNSKPVDSDDSRGYLITGSAMGRVNAWPVHSFYPESMALHQVRIFPVFLESPSSFAPGLG